LIVGLGHPFQILTRDLAKIFAVHNGRLLENFASDRCLPIVSFSPAFGSLAKELPEFGRAVGAKGC
jgi:hypothetical protein